MAEYVPNRVPCSKKPEPTPPPQPEPITGMCDMRGVLYFKLDKEAVEAAGGTWFGGNPAKFYGDDTKNCGLLGNEIDKNFYFLRAMDIETAYTITEGGKKYLVLKRFGCDWAIKVDLTDENAYDHKFWVEDGYIHVQFPDGTEDVFRDDHGNGDPVKFLIDGENVRIVTNETIDGDGTFQNPIGIDFAYRTGTYAPADFFVDITCCGLTIDDVASGIGKGHAVVTKENAGRFGLLYTFGEVEALDNDLKALYGDKGWRVPSREDWGKLLNWAESQDKYRNHDITNPGNLGDCAGLMLKSTEFWADRLDGRTGEGADSFGFAAYPVGHCPETMNTMNPPEYYFQDLYGATTFWSSTKTDDDPRHFEVYVRKFTYGHNDVYQGTESPACRLSLRLVRDVNKDEDYDFDGYAYILGNLVPTVYTTDGTQQWTSINIGFAEYGGIAPKEWEDVETDIEVVTYYKFDSDTCSYDFDNAIQEYDLPSTADTDEIVIYDSKEDVPEPAQNSPEYVGVRSTLHFDMVSEAKFYYNAWDGKKWHKKVMREGESVVILNEDYPNPCDTAATPYVTESNKNHEWRLYIDEQTGLDELIDTVEAIKREIEHDMWGDIDNLQNEVDEIEKSVGLNDDGTHVPYDGMIVCGATTVKEAIEILDAVIVDNEEVTAAALNDLNDRILILSGKVGEITSDFDDLNEKLNQEISARTEGDKELQDALDEETSARTAADEALQEQIDELASKSLEAENKSIVLTQDGNKTLIRVGIEPGDEHIKLGNDGLYFDGEFGGYPEGGEDE